MSDLDVELRERYLPRTIPTDLYLCPDAKELEGIRADNPEFRTELWTVDSFGPARAVILADFLKKRAELPPALDSSPALHLLQVPRALAGALRDPHVRNLEGELRVHGDGIADVSAIGSAPGVTHLGGYKIDLRFDARAFPALRGLATWERNRKRLTKTFAELPQLKALFLAAYKELFADVPPRLGFLQLLYGGIESLEGVSRLPKLEWLMIDRVNKLSSLDALRHHRGLRKVELTHCAALEDVAALATCPKLQIVNVRYCKRLDEKGLASLDEVLRARGGGLKIEV